MHSKSVWTKFTGLFHEAEDDETVPRAGSGFLHARSVAMDTQQGTYQRSLRRPSHRSRNSMDPEWIPMSRRSSVANSLFGTGQPSTNSGFPTPVIPRSGDLGRTRSGELLGARSVDLIRSPTWEQNLQFDFETPARSSIDELPDPEELPDSRQQSGDLVPPWMRQFLSGSGMGRRGTVVLTD